MTEARIMVVEDESITAMALEAQLTRLGYAVTAIAASGEEAINKAAEMRPDLVLMDIKLQGDMDGVQAADELRARFRIPVTYLTAFADERTLKRAQQAAPYGYIVKPFAERDLHATIETALHRRHLEQEIEERQRWLTTVLQAVNDGIIATDRDGFVRFMNRVAESLTGWQHAAALGKELSEVLRKEPARITANAMGTKAGMRHEALLYPKTGKARPIEVSATAARDNSGEIAGFVWAFRDISERQRVEARPDEDLEVSDARHQMPRSVTTAGAQILVVEDEGITATDLERRLTRLGYRVPAIARSGEEAIALAARTRPDLVLMDIRLKGTLDGVQAAAELRRRFGIPVTYLTAYADGETILRAQEAAPYGYLVKPFDERALHAGIQTALHRHQLEQQVEKADHLKGDMIAVVSHELRSSFGAIVGLAELLLNGEFGPLTAEQATHVQSMEESVNRMLELIRTTLDFSRIERQRAPLDLHTVDAADLVAGVIREMSDLPRAPDVRLTYEVAPELPVLVTDPVKLTVVIRNLVSNALKYTEQGSVTVAVRGCAPGIEFCVCDTGVGIPPESQEIIFEPFRQLGGAATRAGGVGLGLYITRRLVELLGGTIRLDSAVGRGSTVCVWIPSEITERPS